METRKPLGPYLVAQGVITEEQLTRATQVQTQTGCLLDEALHKLGYASDEAITVAISKQLSIPYASRENRLLQPRMKAGPECPLDERFSRENAVVPLWMENGTFAVAVSDPGNYALLGTLSEKTGHEILVHIATRAQILQTIDEFFSGGSDRLIDRSSINAERRHQEVDEFAEVRIDLDEVMTTGLEEPAISYVNAVLKQAVAERASDIHLEVYGPVTSLRFRIDGVLFERTQPPRDLYPTIISRIKIMSKLDIGERRLPQDGAMAVKLHDRPIDFRVAICPTVYGENVVLRILDKGSATLDIDKLNLEPRQKEDFLKAVARPHGLIFLTGPTGSGKTTTLYTLLNHIRSPELKIMTAEDPVEFKVDGINQVQMKSAIGLTFANALRSFLRMDPDVILVGEVRDQETAQICLRAAITGHLVLSSLHTNTALEAIPRLIDLGIEPFMVSTALCAVASQRLVRILCAGCKKPYKPNPMLLATVVQEAKLERVEGGLDSVRFYEPGKCAACSLTGFKGRQAIYEVILITPELSALIYREKLDMKEIRECADALGMWNMRTNGWRKVFQGLTTVEEVLSVTIAE